MQLCWMMSVFNAVLPGQPKFTGIHRWFLDLPFTCRDFCYCGLLMKTPKWFEFDRLSVTTSLESVESRNSLWFEVINSVLQSTPIKAGQIPPSSTGSLIHYRFSTTCSPHRFLSPLLPSPLYSSTFSLPPAVSPLVYSISRDSSIWTDPHLSSLYNLCQCLLDVHSCQQWNTSKSISWTRMPPAFAHKEMTFCPTFAPFAQDGMNIMSLITLNNGT